MEPVGRSQPTVSHHLEILRQAGVLTGQKRRLNIWYAAVPAALEALRSALRPGGHESTGVQRPRTVAHTS